MSVREVTRLVAALALALVALTITAGPSSAADCTTWQDENGTIHYDCDEIDPGDSHGGGDGGDPVVTCDLEGQYSDLCIGQDACWMNDPAAVQDPEELKDTPKPNEDSHVVYISCQRPDGSTYDRWYWNEDVPAITIEDRIRSAMGALDLPTIEASFNPPARTLVNLPTWWWAEGAQAGEIRGSEALGMIAVATPRGLSVVPGDGSASQACPMSVTRSDTCTYTYRRSGEYTATLSIVYDIRFEMNGQAIDMAEVPAELRTVTIDDDVPVRVREVQTRVTKVR